AVVMCSDGCRKSPSTRTFGWACLAVFVTLALAWVVVPPGTAAAAETCAASGSTPLVPSPTTGLTVGPPATTGSTIIRLANTSQETSGALDDVDAEIKPNGSVFFKLACADSTCSAELPGTLTFTGCAVCNP